MRAISEPRLPPDAALFLDIDGTLLDLALRPDAVVVPHGLPALLRRLRARLGGSLALVSGRRLAEIDQLFGADLAVGAEHGAVVREAGGAALDQVRPGPGLAQLAAGLRPVVAAHPGALLEEKQFGLAVHWRRAPEAEAELVRVAHALAAREPEVMLQPAHAALELRWRGPGKDGAVAWFLARAPFAGRVPVFIGDDATDLPAIALANQRGGLGLEVAEAFGGPGAVRAWLARLDQGEGGWHG